MGTLQLNNSLYYIASLFSSKPHISHINNPLKYSSKCLNQTSFSRLHKIRVAETVRSDTKSESAATQVEEQRQEEQDQKPGVDFAFVNSVLLPDGTPDVHYRRSLGGQNLRNIMLDNNLELYGPYSRPLLNCGGGGTCATCLVEVVEGKELLSPRTDKEKEKLKRKPKNWRLACQTTVGKPDSRGLVVIQQLPEWKAHEWKYGEPPEEDTIYV